MVDNNLRKIIIVIDIVAVIILSGLLYVQNFSQGSAELSIISSSAYQGNQGPIGVGNNPNLYTLNINLHIKFNGKMHVKGLLNVCSFGFAVNDSSFWNVKYLTCSGIFPTHAHPGSRNFTLTFGIVPWTNYVNVSTPFLVSFMVYSNAFNVDSPYYNLFVTS